MRVKWQYEIGVVDQDYQSARELLAMKGEFADSCYDEKDEESGQAADTAESIPPDDAPPEAEIRNDSYLEHWHPEDATVEIWAQDGEDISSGVRMALKENLVHCRWERQDGVCKAFVLPADEPAPEKSCSKLGKVVRRRSRLCRGGFVIGLRLLVVDFAARFFCPLRRALDRERCGPCRECYISLLTSAREAHSTPMECPWQGSDRQECNRIRIVL
jgi:hypothetical protein